MPISKSGVWNRKIRSWTSGPGVGKTDFPAGYLGAEGLRVARFDFVDQSTIVLVPAVDFLMAIRDLPTTRREKRGGTTVGPFVVNAIKRTVNDVPVEMTVMRGTSTQPDPPVVIAPPESAPDAENLRAEALRIVKARLGQPAFRLALLDAYGSKCAISGCAVIDVLEAAHIRAYAQGGASLAANGLLLRTDIHTLFDYHLVSIDPASLLVLTSSRLADSSYSTFAGAPLRIPTDASLRPDSSALEEHYLLFLDAEYTRVAAVE